MNSADARNRRTSLSELCTDGGELNKDDVSQRLLGVVGDRHGAMTCRCVEFDPLMVLRVALCCGPQQHAIIVEQVILKAWKVERYPLTTVRKEKPGRMTARGKTTRDVAPAPATMLARPANNLAANRDEAIILRTTHEFEAGLCGQARSKKARCLSIEFILELLPPRG